MSFHAPITREAAEPAVYTRQGTPKRSVDGLVREHMPLVRRIAWHVHGSVSSAVDIEDLVQIGLVALVEAVNGFEDRGQVTIAQYLHTRVRGAMIDELRRQATLTRGAMKRRRALQQAEKALAGELGRAPLPEETAARLGVSLDRLNSAYAAAEPVRFEPIDDAYDDQSAWFVCHEPNAAEAVESAQLREVLIRGITALSEREQQVVQLYYVEELNLEEIGQVLGVGAARVCQIKKAAHDKLRAAVAAATE
jgi:RNA polymerase sigma factor FliA